MISFSEAVGHLRAADNVVFLTHKKPDGDTLGSAAALCRGLRQMGKQAWLCKNEETTDKYAFLANDLWYDGVSDIGYVCSVDVADAALLPDNMKSMAIDLAIDHHPSFKDFGALGYCAPEMASCGEIIYSILLELGCQMTPDIANAIYTAVSTDTGCFLYGNTTENSHVVAGACISAGANYKEINYKCFSLKSKAKVALEGHLYSNMSLTKGGRCAVACISRDLIEELSAKLDDMDNLSSLIIQIEGVKAGALLTQNKERTAFKVSMRSNEINVSEICGLFGGGGHVAAAGCTIEGTDISEAIKTIEAAIGASIDA